METLAKLFGGLEKVKLMRLFVENPEEIIPLTDLARRAKVSPRAARREMANLGRIAFVKLRKLVKPADGSGWQLNPAFPYLGHLRQIVKSDITGRYQDLPKRFAKGGRLSLLLVAGVFIGEADSRADLVVVGDRLKRQVIERVIRDLEAEIGRELNYAVMDTKDFVYRRNACDRFVRDVLDYPHEKVLDRVGL